MARERGGALWRTPARASTSGVWSDENVPPGGALDAAPSTPVPTAPGTASRPPLRDIQPQGQPWWLVPAPKGILRSSAAGKTPSRVGAVTTCLGPTKSLRKPVLGLEFSKTGVSSGKIPRSKVRDAILFWEENRDVQKDDSHAPSDIQDCSDESFMRNPEDILKLQLDLTIIKTILVEEVKARAETCRQKEETERQLDAAKSVIDALESQLIILINDRDELKKKNFQSIHCGKGYVAHQEPKMRKLKCSDSDGLPLDIKLKKMQASLKKARDLNKRYRGDEQEKDEIRRQVEIETAEVILSLTEELSSLQQQLDASNKKELLTRQSLDENHRILLLLDEAIETLLQKGVLEQCYVSLLRRMEGETRQLEFQLDQSKRCYEARLKELEIKMASLISWSNKEIAMKRKIYAEDKNEEVKLLERSIEDLEITVCSLENEVKLFKEEAEQQKRQREKVEVELQNVKLLFLAVPSSGKADRSLEDTTVNLLDSISHPSHINNELLGVQESRRISWEEAFEKESEISVPVQEGPTGSMIRHGHNMGMLLPFEEQLQGSYASSSRDIFKEAGDVSLPDSHSLPQIASQKKLNLNPVDTLADEAASLVENLGEPGESSSDEHMQYADRSGVELATQSSDKDVWSESPEFKHPIASDELEQSSASNQPDIFGGGANSDKSLSAFDSQQVETPAVELVIEVLKEDKLPPVAPVRSNDPVNFMRAPSDGLKRLRGRNHYEEHRTATDRRFWSIEQQDLYTSIYSRAKVFDMKWIDWEHIDSIDQFACVRKFCAHLGLEQIMSYCCDWDSELIRQFYSTVHINADKSSMTWMTHGRRITTSKRAWEERFGIHGSIHTTIHSQFLLDDDQKRILYTSAECTVGQMSDLSPLAVIANRIIRRTIYPRSGNTLHGHNWNLLYHIVEQRPFDIIALIFSEIDLLISDHNRTKDLLPYAPFIMGMIMRAFEYDGPRECKHHSYKPRHSYKLKQTKKVNRRSAPAVATPFEPPPSAFHPKVEAHVESNDHDQFEAAGHQTQGEVVQGQAVLAQPITRTDLLQVFEDGLRPIRDSLASMEGRIDRVQGRRALPVQRTKVPAPRSSLAPSFQVTIPAPRPDPTASKQTNITHGDSSDVSVQPAIVRPSHFSRFNWYKREK